ncbi:hypothetical protein KS4_22710 [Poriferisphaera corsica]|uniref:Uncharacterized protein n=1 Tax=Poriferisphaera corsica TaxID=2528020 RepID=A0A517YVH4_9BACT|nr:hypothetical protein [Poriferisphaera corsica]QDU34206.1 hypothetical protein KS4_22710 [Poriferisphaera corsica]
MPIIDTLKSDFQDYRRLWQYRFTHHRKLYRFLILAPIALIILYLITYLTYYLLANNAYNQLIQGHTLQSLNQKFYDAFPNDHADPSPFYEAFELLDPDLKLSHNLNILIESGTYTFVSFPPDEDLSTQHAAIINRLLEETSQSLDMLKSLRATGPVQFHLPGQPEYNHILDHTVHIYHATSLLSLRTIRHLRNNRINEAYDDMLLMIQLSNTIAHIPRNYPKMFLEIIYRNNISHPIMYAVRSDLLNQQQLLKLQQALILPEDQQLNAQMPDLIRQYAIEYEGYFNEIFNSEDEVPDLLMHYMVNIHQYTFLKHYDRKQFADLGQQYLEQAEQQIYIYPNNSGNPSYSYTTPLTNFAWQDLSSFNDTLAYYNHRNLLIRELAAARYTLDHNASPTSPTHLIPDYIDDLSPIH